MLAVTLFKLEFLGRVEIARIQAGTGSGFEIGKLHRVAGKQACLDQGGLDCDIGVGGLKTFVQCAYAVTDLDAGIPEEGDERFETLPGVRAGVSGQQQEDVDVRIWIQFAPTIAADGDERRALAQARVAPKRYQDAVHQLGVRR